MRDPLVSSATCHMLFAYDVGLGIRLEEAGQLLRGRSPGWEDRPHSTPRYLDFKNPPLKVLLHGAPVDVGALQTAPDVEAVVFDFGAISITYRLQFAGPLSELVPLSSTLYENSALLVDSRARVGRFLETIATAVNRPHIAPFVEDYVVFQIAALSDAELREPERVVAANEDILARVVRSETRTLSPREVQDALGSRIAYAMDEEAIIDWNGAILFQADVTDARTVLEYANVALLEMRWLDEQLDHALDRSYVALSKGAEGRWRRSFPLIPDREIREIARLQTDSAVLLEGVTNALKFVGDPYLARLYRLVSGRMHLADWDAGIVRKLHTVESIYQKLSDQAATRRLEFLEWIVIILIALSILLVFV